MQRPRARTARWWAPPINARRSRTLNIAPTWTRVLSANTVFTVRRFRPAGPISLLPQRQSVRRPGARSDTCKPSASIARLTDLGLRANVSYVKGIHNLKIGAVYSDTILTEKDAIRNRRSHGQRALPECRRKSQHRSIASPVRRGAGNGLMQNPELRAAAWVLRPDADRPAARLRRLSHFHQRRL